MIYACIRQLCILSVFCGAALSVTPEGSVKKIAEIVCAVILILTVIVPLRNFDYESYALELAKYNDREQTLLTDGSNAQERLNRLVIQSEYASYIMDKAKETGIGNAEVEVEAQWDTDGLWVPYSVKFRGAYTESQQKELCSRITAELGIPKERQQWENVNE